MNFKVTVLILLLFVMVFLIGCTTTSDSLVCGDMVCRAISIDLNELNPDSNYYCALDCGLSNIQTDALDVNNASAQNDVNAVLDIESLVSDNDSNSSYTVIESGGGVVVWDTVTDKNLFEVNGVDSGDIRLKNIEYVTNSAVENSGYTIVKNFPLGEGETKTIYIERKNPVSNGVCFSDTQSLNTKEDITAGCTTIACPGKLGNYSCEIEGSNFAVSGLKHSGGVEVVLPIFPTNENALCIYNSNSELSKSICDYYVSKRPGVNSVGINVPDSVLSKNRELMDNVADFKTYVVTPVMDWVASHPQFKITHLAVAKDVPYQVSINHVTIGASYLSGAESLAYPDSSENDGTQNLYANKKIHFDPESYKDGSGRYTPRFAVSYLLGYNIDDIKKMIDRGTGTAPDLLSAKWVIDRDEDRFSVDDEVLLFSESALLDFGISGNNIILERTNTRPVNISGSLIAYAGPGAHHAGYGWPWIAANPAIIANVSNRAIMTSYESWNAINFTGSPGQTTMEQGKIADAFSPIAFGGSNYSSSFSGAAGYVHEPYSERVYVPSFFGAYASSLTLAESFMSATLPVLGRSIVVGDPLMRATDLQQVLKRSGELCSVGSECNSGYCDSDVDGVKKCHSTQGNCVMGFGFVRETQNGSAICFNNNNTLLYKCVNGNWAQEICGQGLECATSVPAASKELFVSGASCKSPQGMQCASNSDCRQGVCSANLNGAKMCHQISSSCVNDDFGNETINSRFACSGDNKKKQCVNGVWSAQETTCANGCSNGVCVGEQIENGAKLKLSIGVYSLTLPVDPTSHNISDIFRNAPDGTTIYTYKEGQFIGGNIEFGEWVNKNMQLNPGEGFKLDVPVGVYNEVLSGSIINSPVSIKISGELSFIGVPFCGDKYTASQALAEIKSVNSGCYAISMYNGTGSGPTYYWDDGLGKNSFNFAKKDFKLNNYEGYFLSCDKGVDFTWMPSCRVTSPCSSFTYSDWTGCGVNGTQTRTVVSSTPVGCQGGDPVISQTCTYIPPCSSFTYSTWGECQVYGIQQRTLVSKTPQNCVGGNPVLVQECTYVPLCTVDNWTSSLAPVICPVSGQQTKTWSKIGNCQGGVTHSASEIVSCDYSMPACTSFVYSNWGVCSPSGIQTRTISSSTPTSCQGGNPVLAQTCLYTPACYSFTYSTWGACQSNGAQSRVVLTSIPTSCQGGNPVLTQACSYNLICTAFTYSDWGACQSNNTQSRVLISSGPNNCYGGVPILTQNCSYAEYCAVNPSSCSTVWKDSLVASDLGITSNATGGTQVVDNANGKKLLQVSNVQVTDSRFEDINVLRNGITAPASFLIVKGMELSEDETKTVYLEKIDPNSNGVCIKDEIGVETKADIENGCVQLKCPGKRDGYACTVENGFYMVSGLKHSGVMEAMVTNELPSVAITSPLNGTSFTSPALVKILVSASDSDGGISRIEFYDGAVNIGEDSNYPYYFIWEDVLSGNYSITAKAIDNTNGTTVSSLVNIVVNEPSNSGANIFVIAFGGLIVAFLVIGLMVWGIVSRKPPEFSGGNREIVLPPKNY